MSMLLFLVFFFFNDTATTEIYTLSLHDALPICQKEAKVAQLVRTLEDNGAMANSIVVIAGASDPAAMQRSEEHTSELQSQSNLVCRLLLEKKKKKNIK